jgi:putative RecB family exonuclease
MVKIYSHSRLSTFEQCPLKFKFKYIEKIPELKKSIESCLGKAVHGTLEWLYLNAKEGKIREIEEVIQQYVKNWEENYDPQTMIVNQGLSKEDYFNKGVAFLLNYYTANRPFDDNTLEVEKRIVVELDEQGEYKIQGFIDRLAYNLEKNRYEIHDYKTANNLPSQDSMDADRQLALYSIAIKEIYGGDKEVILIWHYLAHNKKIHSKRTPEQLTELKKQTLELIKKIELTREFPPKKSALCHWCPYKSICPAWGNKPFKIERQKTLNSEEELDIWN